MGLGIETVPTTVAPSVSLAKYREPVTPTDTGSALAKNPLSRITGAGHGQR
jgi:hypothetical protein